MLRAEEWAALLDPAESAAEGFVGDAGGVAEGGAGSPHLVPGIFLYLSIIKET